MFIKLQPNVIKPSWINKQKLLYVKGYSETLQKNVTGLVPVAKEKFVLMLQRAKDTQSTVVVERIPSTRLKDKYLLNAAK